MQPLQRLMYIMPAHALSTRQEFTVRRAPAAVTVVVGIVVVTVVVTVVAVITSSYNVAVITSSYNVAVITF